MVLVPADLDQGCQFGGHSRKPYARRGRRSLPRTYTLAETVHLEYPGLLLVGQGSIRFWEPWVNFGTLRCAAGLYISEK